MSKNTGKLTVAELTKLVANDEIDTVLVGVTDLYGRFVGKRYDAEFFLESAVPDGAHACDYLFTVDMEMNPVQGYAFTNWEKGYGDVHMQPDLDSLRLADWLPRSAMVLCKVLDSKDHSVVEIAPRSILERQCKQAAAAGFTAMAASELEYYIFEDSYRQAAEQNYQDLQAAGWYLEDYHMLQGTRHEGFHSMVRRHLRKSGVPVENSKGEWGKGQHELNVRYAEAMEMADRHIVYKQCLKEVADQMGISVTFMAKLAQDQAGSSCHIHMSLWNKDKNAFPGDQSLGPVQCSDTFRWFLGGWIKHVPEMMVCYAPTVNSYKRYQAGSWAPTRLTWSYDNRTAGFRVVGSGQSLRIECRIPGADCNPYLAYAAALASGLDGIAKQIEPPALFDGDIYAAEDLPLVPGSLREATELFSASDFAKQSFGNEVVEHLSHFYRNEEAAYQLAVTDWERRRYFEQI